MCPLALSVVYANFRGFGFVRMKDPAGRSQSLLFWSPSCYFLFSSGGCDNVQ
jgi:hypothetical protein